MKSLIKEVTMEDSIEILEVATSKENQTSAPVSQIDTSKVQINVEKI